MIIGRINKKNVVLTVLISLSVILCIWYHIHTKVTDLDEYFSNIDDEDGETKEDILEESIMHQKHQEYLANEKHIKYLKETINKINDNQHVTNDYMFSDLQFENTVLVVQVHSNIRYLAVLLDSMRRVNGITRSLVIFSHDFYDENINNVIKNITFSKVMQIFYPYSVQLHHNRYPGWDAKFCQEIKRCDSNKTRNAVLAQKKLYWWWTLNQVFDHIEIMKKYNGFIYFLEAEQYLAKDFVYISKMMESLLPVFCPQCVIIGTGTQRAPLAKMYSFYSSSLVVSTWGWSNFTNSGIGFNRTLWNSIKKLKEMYCKFDDYGWDYSLRYLASNTPEKQFFMLSSGGPRVFPTSGCGVRESLPNDPRCILDSNYFDILKFVWTIKSHLFPHNFGLRRGDLVQHDADAGRGNWSDARDRELCVFLASKGRREYY